jgi:hypothetical protein
MLGGLLDDLGGYDRAFDHFTAGNALRPTDYDPERVAARMDRIIGLFSAERLAALPRAQPRPDLPSDLPVFIVGTPRSGTSLVEQVLSAHSQVHAAGEPRVMMRIAADLGLGFHETDEEASGSAPDGDSVAAAGERYLQGLHAGAGGASRVTDRSPCNFERLGLISVLFPQARVIHCRRDPLDSCLSCYFRNFTRGNFQTFDLRHLGHFYRQYERLMAHWRDVLDLAMLEVPYESLVEDPERTCRDVLAFLGLDWEPACLRFQESGPDRETGPGDPAGEPIHQESVGRWRNYETRLGPLKKALGRDT